MRGRLTRPPRPLPPWWPEGRPWPPPDPAARPRPKPAWWPAGEPWPPPRAPRSDLAVSLGIALVLAVLLNLIAIGVLGPVRGLADAVPWTYAWPVGALALALVTAGVFVLAMRAVGSPVSDIVLAARRVADGDLSVRLNEAGLPWLRSVARAFNTMTARLDRQQRERRALMADIAHELRTPLAIIQGRVEGMLDGVYPRDEPHIRQVLEETRMLGRLVEDLRTSAEADSGALHLRTEPADLAILMEDAAGGLRPDAGARRVAIDVQAGEDLPLADVDPQRIREVLVNLLSNAVRHSPDGGLVRIDGRLEDGALVVRVEDQGPGIPPGDRERVFERFHKDPASRGSGLGLTIARSLVTAHGGALTAENRAGGGTVFTITLPRGRGAAGRP